MGNVLRGGTGGGLGTLQNRGAVFLANEAAPLPAINGGCWFYVNTIHRWELSLRGGVGRSFAFAPRRIVSRGGDLRFLHRSLR